MTTRPRDPWDALRPVDELHFNARRIEESSRWDIFWAMDSKAHPLLILQHADETDVPSPLPRFRGLEIVRHQLPGRYLLVVRLLGNEHREIFHRLCVDIIATCEKAISEKEAIALLLERTRNWHRFLAGVADDKLSDEAQRGLIGELTFLETHLSPPLGLPAAVESWSGPFGTTKDFEIGRICVEVKTHLISAPRNIHISSEHQLDTEGTDSVYLYVLELARATEGSTDTEAVTLPDVVERVRSLIMTNASAAIDAFEKRLSATGFNSSHDYSDRKWIKGDEHLFKIDGDFPRITPSMYPRGVSDVSYLLPLSGCEPYRVPPSLLVKHFLGEDDDD